MVEVGSLRSVMACVVSIGGRSLLSNPLGHVYIIWNATISKALSKARTMPDMHAITIVGLASWSLLQDTGSNYL